MSELLDDVLNRQWLHGFKLPGGDQLPTLSSDDTERFNQARCERIDAVLNQEYQDKFDTLRVVDLSCKQGYFGLHLAAQGVLVAGIDADKSHVADANLMARALDLSDNFKARRATIEDVMPEKYGRFDVVLMLGLVYHLENPVAAIRTAFSLTKDMCLIETHQLSGQENNHEALVSVVNCVDEPQGFEESQSDGLCLVPNPKALLMMMESVGFKKVSIVPLPKDGTENHRLRKRVLAIGYK